MLKILKKVVDRSAMRIALISLIIFSGCSDINVTPSIQSFESAKRNDVEHPADTDQIKNGELKTKQETEEILSESETKPYLSLLKISFDSVKP